MEKPVNFELVPQKHEAYRLLAEALIWHAELAGAYISLAWRIQTAADKDGHVVLGRCKKVGDLEKEFSEFDFIIVLNQEFWELFDDSQRLALLDHELSHAAPVKGIDGKQILDERGRKVWRIRKHDIEEFTSVVARHGTWKKDLEEFAKAILQKRNSPLLSQICEETEQPHQMRQ